MKSVGSFVQAHTNNVEGEALIVVVRDGQRPADPLQAELESALIQFGALQIFTYPEGSIHPQKIVTDICDIVQDQLYVGFERFIFVGDLQAYMVIKELADRGFAPYPMDLILLDAFRDDQAGSIRQDPRLDNPELRDDVLSGIRVISIQRPEANEPNPVEGIANLWAITFNCDIEFLVVDDELLEDPEEWARCVAHAVDNIID